MAASSRSTARRSRQTAARAYSDRQSRYYTEGNAARKLSETQMPGRMPAAGSRAGQADRVQARPSANRTGRAGTRSTQNRQANSRQRSAAARRQSTRQTRTYERTYTAASRAAVLQTPAREAVLSEQARKNQLKALNTNRGFVFFLTLAMIAVMGCCVNYIRLKSEYTAKMGTVANLEAELAQIKEDNDAYYSQVTSNVDLARIKKIAIGRLGMKYPSENQMASYTTSEGSGYVRQYQDLPE